MLVNDEVENQEILLFIKLFKSKNNGIRERETHTHTPTNKQRILIDYNNYQYVHMFQNKECINIIQILYI